MSIFNYKNKSFLKNKRFRNFLIGSSVSWLGSSMDNMIFTLIAIDITGSPASVGVMLMVLSLPNFLFSLFGGTFADMFDKKKIIVWTNYIRCVLIGIILVLFVFNKLNFFLLCAVLFIVESLSNFCGPATAATIPRLLTKQEYFKARSFSGGILQGISMIGPSISTVLVALTGYWVPLTVDSLSYLFAGKMVSVTDMSDIQEKSTAKRGIKEVVHNTVDGFRYIKSNKFLVKLVIIILLMNLVLGLFDVPLPFMMKENFNLDKTYYAYLKTIFAGAGLLSTIFLTKYEVKKPGKTIILFMFIMGGALILFGLSKNYYLACVLSAISAFFRTCIAITLWSFISIISDDKYRGRVVATIGMVITSVVPLSNGVSGILVERFPAGMIFTFGGVVFIIISLIYCFDSYVMNYTISEEANAVGA
ncbi:MFS transporter [Oceanirhabdus sp. W0125-5]|uniref:MFS transporter n=1 Tax=Oceanirhabdus sp. W0125-5 TaxID=2999116 RepID=UPI0022F33CA4|nr:MFS transporter [Oceanirhabdus sp. W0125-5]WBW95292.1 MFS transporter [Oceanirhabdus sp. W0125-5]